MAGTLLPQNSEGVKDAEAEVSSRPASDRIAMTASQHFRFFDLPPELWLKISKMAIDDCPVIETDDLLLGETVTAKAPLTNTCRLLRNEILPYYLQTKTSITVNTHSCALDDVGVWARSFAPSTRAKVTGVRLSTYFPVQLLADREEWLSKYWELKVKLVRTEKGGIVDEFPKTEHFNVKILE